VYARVTVLEGSPDKMDQQAGGRALLRPSLPARASLTHRRGVAPKPSASEPDFRCAREGCISRF
jgi:hypothetical protein